MDFQRFSWKPMNKPIEWVINFLPSSELQNRLWEWFKKGYCTLKSNLKHPRISRFPVPSLTSSVAISSRASAILNRHKRQHWWLQSYELFLNPKHKYLDCVEPFLGLEIPFQNHWVFLGSDQLPLCLWAVAHGDSWSVRLANSCSLPTFSRDRWELCLPQATGMSMVLSNWIITPI